MNNQLEKTVARIQSEMFSVIDEFMERSGKESLSSAAYHDAVDVFLIAEIAKLEIAIDELAGMVKIIYTQVNS